MKKNLILSFLTAGLLCGCSSERTPADYVNPFIGACTSTEAAGVYHGLGKTFPGATTPFGMAQVSPNTITGGDNSCGYSYEMKTIEGFCLTQLSGVGWFGDLGNFMIMPTTGPLKTIAGKEDGSIDGWRSAYDKTTEEAHPGYYKVMLSDYGILAECSATPHCGILKFTYPECDTSRIQVDFARRVAGTAESQYVKVIDSHTLEGWMRCTPETGGLGNGDGNANYTLWFHAEFSKDFDNYGFWSADIPDGIRRRKDEVVSLEYLQRVSQSEIIRGVEQLEGRHLGFFSEFPTSEGSELEVKVGISFVDQDGARKNFAQEVADKDFTQVKNEARAAWNRELSKITVSGGSEEEKTVFYTALYHSLIDPRIYADVDGRYVGGDLKVHEGSDNFTKRTIFSGWDVFRSQMPLQTIINPQVVNDLLASLTTLAQQSGRDYFERWEFLNAYTGCMVGNPAISVLADAWSKGIRNFDIEKAYEYAVNTVEKFGNYPLGWTPSSYCISETLEYAYFDWCLSTLASALGKDEDASRYLQHSQAFRNVFDPEKAWFRPRFADGAWAEWPENARTREWYGCVECNSYQQGWFVPQDYEGMAELMGGREKVLADLENFFEKTPDNMLWNEYYNHSNEPVHFVPFIFNRLGEPWNTQKWTRFICSHAYSSSPITGLVGNDDAGQMSAWYVLTAAGLHPSCPGDKRMEITSPVFDKVVIKTDPEYASGKEFKVIAHGNSPENIYIQRAKLNGEEIDRCYLDFDEIARGGVLELFMSDQPSSWGYPIDQH